MPWFGFRVRHPFYRGSPARPAVAFTGLCAALAGTFEELKTAARQGARAGNVVFILTGGGRTWPERNHRDELWRLFRVPAYVILLDASGRPQAWECEAHDGLHVGGENPRCPQGFLLETEPCPCGRPGPRLLRMKGAALVMAGD